jgi:hypothetical protein
MRMDYLYVKGGAKARRQGGAWKKFQDNKKMRERSRLPRFGWQ